METKCPICGKEFKNFKGFISHISKQKDKEHIFINGLRKFTEIDNIEDLTELYESQKQFITDDIESNNNFLNKFKKAKDPSKKDEVKRLINYFYSQRGTFCKSWFKDTKVIRSYLEKGLSVGNTISVLRYMIMKRYDDLSYFGNTINEALQFEKFIIEKSQEGTAAYLTNMFHKLRSESINNLTFVKEVKKVEEVLQFDSYETVKNTLVYMTQNDCNSIHFLANKINEIKTKHPELIVHNTKINNSNIINKENNILSAVNNAIDNVTIQNTNKTNNIIDNKEEMLPISFNELVNKIKNNLPLAKFLIIDNKITISGESLNLYIKGIKNKTLTDKDITYSHRRIINKLKQELTC